MAAKTASIHTTRPISYYWGVVKDMDDINAIIDEAERQIAAGHGTPHEEVMREWDEE